MYKTVAQTNFGGMIWNAYALDEIGNPTYKYNAACVALQINFNLNITLSKIAEVFDKIHNFVEAYLQDAEELKNGGVIQTKKAP